MANLYTAAVHAADPRTPDVLASWKKVHQSGTPSFIRRSLQEPLGPTQPQSLVIFAEGQAATVRPLKYTTPENVVLVGEQGTAYTVFFYNLEANGFYQTKIELDRSDVARLSQRRTGPKYLADLLALVVDQARAAIGA